MGLQSYGTKGKKVSKHNQSSAFHALVGSFDVQVSVHIVNNLNRHERKTGGLGWNSSLAQWSTSILYPKKEHLVAGVG